MIVQFPGFFIELLTLAEPDKLGERFFSTGFGAYNGDFIEAARRPVVADPGVGRRQADEAAFRQGGIAIAEV